MESSREGEAQMAGEAPGILNSILQPRERGCELTLRRMCYTQQARFWDGEPGGSPWE